MGGTPAKHTRDREARRPSVFTITGVQHQRFAKRCNAKTPNAFPARACPGQWTAGHPMYSGTRTRYTLRLPLPPLVPCRSSGQALCTGRTTGSRCPVHGASLRRTSQARTWDWLATVHPPGHSTPDPPQQQSTGQPPPPVQPARRACWLKRRCRLASNPMPPKKSKKMTDTTPSGAGSGNGGAEDTEGGITGASGWCTCGATLSVHTVGGCFCGQRCRRAVAVTVAANGS